MIGQRARDEVPWLTRAQMVEVDRLMVEDYRIGLMQMMENAGRHLAILARWRFLNGDPRDCSVVVLAGSGGNGGGVLVCARHLANWGARVRVCLTKPSTALSGVPRRQLEGLVSMGLPIAQGAADVEAEDTPDLVVDGLIGYSLSGAPQGVAADLIRWAGVQAGPVLALDVPSGVDVDTGEALPPTIRATATMTLALPKVGLQRSEATPYVGELYLADISVPPGLYAGVGVDVGPDLFARYGILHLV